MKLLFFVSLLSLHMVAYSRLFLVLSVLCKVYKNASLVAGVISNGRETEAKALCSQA
jgi:hypothetical protein